jgi:hypothetical protein
MDWANENWVKLYTRSTPDWNSWPWQSRALMPLLMREVDAAGQIGIGRSGVAGLAATVRLPEDVTQIGLDGLVADGCVTVVGQLLTVESYVEAQEARTSVKERSQRARDRRNAMKSQNTTVTARHAAPQRATNRIEKSREEKIRKDSVPASPGPMKPAEEVYRHWASVLGKDPSLPMGEAWGIIGARLKEGFTVDQLKAAAEGAKRDAQRWPERAAQNEIKILYGSAGQVRKFIDAPAVIKPVFKPGFQDIAPEMKNDPSIHPRDLWKIG